MTVRALNIYLSLGGHFPPLLSVPGFCRFKSENVSLVPAKSYPVPQHTGKEETSKMSITTAASSMSSEGIFDMVLEYLNFFSL